MYSRHHIVFSFTIITLVQRNISTLQLLHQRSALIVVILDFVNPGVFCAIIVFFGSVVIALFRASFSSTFGIDCKTQILIFYLILISRNSFLVDFKP